MASLWLELIRFLCPLSFRVSVLDLRSWGFEGVLRLEATLTQSLKLKIGPWECLALFRRVVVRGERCRFSSTAVSSGIASKAGAAGFGWFSCCPFRFRNLIFFLSTTLLDFSGGSATIISSDLNLRRRSAFLLLYGSWFCKFLFTPASSSDTLSSGMVIYRPFLGDWSSAAGSSRLLSGLSMTLLSSKPLSSGMSLVLRS